MLLIYGCGLYTGKYGSQETGDEGDQDWTPEEAETAYEQARDDDCGQRPDPKYVYFFPLFVLLSLSLS